MVVAVKVQGKDKVVVVVKEAGKAPGKVGVVDKVQDRVAAVVEVWVVVDVVLAPVVNALALTVVRLFHISKVSLVLR
ncbi:MAG: hypothetical protein ABII79_06195 [bacterium]